MNLRNAIGCALVALLAACSAESVDGDVESSDNSIVGGQEAQPGSWPGTVALYKNGYQACGGALISDEWVLTAGHCVTTSSANGGFSKVVINRHKLSSSEGEQITVKKAIRHAGFNNQTLDNDLALLQLTTKTTAKPVTLVRAQDASELVENAEVITVGWGTTSESGSTSDVLREVTVPVISNETCKTFSKYNTVTPNQICAGYPEGKKDSCQGDSGGPLFQIIDGKQVEVGLVSWGIGCARAKQPGVYTRIGNYLDWIKEQTGGAVGGGTRSAAR